MLGFIFVSSASWAQTTFTINSTADRANANPGNGVCNTGVQITVGGVLQDECTLRAAIEEANQADGTRTFNIASGISTIGGLTRIRVQTALPYINQRVILAGETHPLFEDVTGRPRLYIEYVGTATGTSGLRFSAGGARSTVRHVGIIDFPNSGILLSGGFGYTITDNVIGVLWEGSASALAGNGMHGIDMSGASAGGNASLVTRNIVLGSGGHGIVLRNGTASAVVVGNVIGLHPPTSPTGPHVPIPGWGNAEMGIFIASSAGSGNLIGDFFTGPNTISNNGAGGLHIMADGQNILGNHVGIPVNGQLGGYQLDDFGNLGSGIVLESSDNVVGGTGAAANIIGNAQHVGIRIGNGGATPVVANNNQIRRNYIGTTPDEDNIGQSQGVRIDNGSGNTIVGAQIANNINGIEFRAAGNSASRNTIVNQTGTGVWFSAPGTLGGDSLDAANVIGNNIRGVVVATTGSGLVSIRNNYIGTNVAMEDLGNTDSGIRVDGTNTVDIGGPDGRNFIGFNGIGIDLRTASGVWVMGNRIGLSSTGGSIGNGTGIRIGAPNLVTSGNRIGYLAMEAIPDHPIAGTNIGNAIAFNQGHGINMDEWSGATQLNNVIRGNSFRANGGQGIYLGPNGGMVDIGGAATGPNRLQNFPELDADNISYRSDTNTLAYRLRIRTETANASYPLVVDFYLSLDGTAQGRQYLGSVTYESANAMSWVSGTFNPPGSIQILGRSLVATATDSDGNTSQFSPSPVLLLEQDSIFGDRFQN